MASLNREKRRILLVEDQKDAREIAALNLEEYTLIFAHDFDEGLRLARRGYFDLYILDNWLPDGAGVELCRVIRGFDPHTPILFYSACSYKADLEAAFSAGAQEYFVKPVIFDDLNRAVTQRISAARETTFEALRAELAAIREDIATRWAINAERRERAKENYLRAEERYLRAEEKMIRLKAEKAFLDAGGTRGEFARQWPSVLTEEVRSARASDAANGK